MSESVKAVSPTPGAEDRADDVRAMFDQIAPKYDRANRILSLGLDQSWRRGAIRLLKDKGQGDVLDLCTGTLDLAEMLVRRGAKSVVALDFSAEMIAAGEHKIREDDPVRTVVADARELPLEDNSVDAIICAFGLRNVPELHRVVAECARVLRPRRASGRSRLLPADLLAVSLSSGHLQPLCGPCGWRSCDWISRGIQLPVRVH